MAIARKKNVAGYYDEVGRFRPIRSPQFVGAGRRKATKTDRRKYSKAKAGDLGEKRQQLAREDVFDREIRVAAEYEKGREAEFKSIEMETAGVRSDGRRERSLMQFVRSAGGVRRTFRHGGRKGHSGKRSSYDAGEIDRLSFKQTGKRGLTTDAGGKDLDGMFKAAREAGYPVSDIWDMVGRIEDEAGGGNAVYPTHGYQDYRDNPKKNGVLVGDTEERRKDLYVVQLADNKFGVYRQKLLIGTRATKISAEKFMNAFRAKLKKNPLAAGVKTIRRHNAKPSASIKRPAASRRNPSSFETAVRNKFVKFLNLRGYKSLAKEVKAGADIEKAVKVIYGHEPQAIQTKLRQFVKLVKNPSAILKSNPLDALSAFASAAVGIASSLQIKEYFDSKKPQGSEAKATKRKRGTTAAKSEGLVSNPSLAEMNRCRRIVAAADKEKGKWVDIPIIRERNPKAMAKKKNPVKASAKTPRSSSKASPRKATARKNPPVKKNALKRMAKPAKMKISAAQIAALVRSLKGQTLPEFGFNASRILGNGFEYDTAKLRKAFVILNAEKKNPTKPRPAASVKTPRLAANDRKAVARSTRKKNATKVPHRRTFSMFNGRPATKAKVMPVSKLAPARLDQLGDLIELRLTNGQTLKLNPRRFKLAAAGGRLWITGGKFAKANPKEKPNVLNPVAEIAHVVYGTTKPHHGDNSYTHYIHKLGEETGHRPILAVDREGFPVIRGGRYKIESRGIVN